MLIIKLLKRAVVDLVIVAMAALVFTPIYSTHGELEEAEAEDFSVVTAPAAPSYPYTKTFTISAYYSPLPCQNKYTTGSYEGDIRLNGNGTNGADGTPVYPGMVAAPKTYSFGTKLYIPGIGTTAVHDRGGAIVVSGQKNQVYDRLDIWMGYGDRGLTRALQWGKRNVEVTVYGVNASLTEVVELGDYSPSEAVPQDCSFTTSDAHVSTADAVVTPSAPITVVPVSPTAVVETTPSPAPVKEQEVSSRLGTDLQLGSSGESVRQLQEELTSLSYYKGPVTGYYGELTEHAIFKFQQSQFLAGDRSSAGAGIFGPKTRDRMNEILASRNYTKMLASSNPVDRIKDPAQEVNKPVVVSSTAADDFSFADGFEATSLPQVTSSSLLSGELNYGMVGPEVKRLQLFLRDSGFFEGALITDYFGPVTKEAVISFQLKHGIIDSQNDLGAGRIGPATLALINNFS